MVARALLLGLLVALSVLVAAAALSWLCDAVYLPVDYDGFD